MATPHKTIVFLMLLGWNSMLFATGSNSGSQGCRGKRSLDQQTQSNEKKDTSNELVSTTDSTFPHQSGLRRPNLSNFPLNLVKRAPMGFLGMRGKKDMDDDLATQAINSDPFLDGLLRPTDSRFSSINLADNDLYQSPNDMYEVKEKRAPNGFLGMRGKKDTLLDELQYLENLRDLDKDLQQRLQNERRLLADFARQYEGFEMTPIDSGGGAIKRAPSTGFFGMRGKKTYAEALDEASKRAGPGLGFVGMRGKKWVEEVGDSENELNDIMPLDGGGAKRAPSMGFHGMRGKKDVNQVMLAEKRAPSAGFFGMRGKKVPSGFFGTRGKKGPFELRHKFVGVRGKKVPGGVPAPQFQLRMGNEYLMPEMQSAHLADAELESNKRAPTGFQGMRGKKWSPDATMD